MNAQKSMVWWQSYTIATQARMAWQEDSERYKALLHSGTGPQGFHRIDAAYRHHLALWDAYQIAQRELDAC